jgi:hypothetical protein
MVVFMKPIIMSASDQVSSQLEASEDINAIWMQRSDENFMRASAFDPLFFDNYDLLERENRWASQ